MLKCRRTVIDRSRARRLDVTPPFNRHGDVCNPRWRQRKRITMTTSTSNIQSMVFTQLISIHTHSILNTHPSFASTSHTFDLVCPWKTFKYTNPSAGRDTSILELVPRMGRSSVVPVAVIISEILAHYCSENIKWSHTHPHTRS